MARTGRPKIGTEQYNIRLTEKQHSTLQQLAANLGYKFNPGGGEVGSISLLCQAIADGIADGKIVVLKNDA